MEREKQLADTIPNHSGSQRSTTMLPTSPSSSLALSLICEKTPKPLRVSNRRGWNLYLTTRR